jgi:acetate kinase
MGCKKFLPKVTQVAVFDTAFHQTIPEQAYMYPIPEHYYIKYKVRKYGFHGTSHQFVAHRAAKVLKRPLNKLKLITCHLGNGCSITAVDRAKSIDTSMGFTPLEGLMMGTRCGDIDVAAVFYIMQKAKLSISRMDSILNKESGLLGISQISNDIRPIRQKAKRGNALAKLALEMFIYRIKKYIGAYLLMLGEVDAVCFTAGIGENCSDITNKIKRDIKKLTNNRTKVLIIHTDEELMIADHAYHLSKKR